MGKLKDFFNRIKEENKNLAVVTQRINAVDFCGAINRGLDKDAGGFWHGDYISITGEHGLIYGSGQEDYSFTIEDVVSAEVVPGAVMISWGNQQKPGVRFIVDFRDGKRAQADILTEKVEVFRMLVGLGKKAE